MAAFTPTGVEFVAKGLGGYLGDLKKADKAQQKLGKAAGSVGKSFSGLGKNILKVGAIASAAAVGGIAALSAGVVGLGVSATNTAISFESAFAGVTKTTDGLLDDTGELTEAGRQLRGEFVDLSREIPKSFEELAAIGEIGGQLGVGREALVDFTETVAALGVSTNLAEEEAATALARIANIFEVETKDIGDNTERLGSTIVGLGNNFATTEREIVDFATRIAGAGKIVGFTQEDILAFSTAFSSVGVQAEAGGTATQAALLAIEDAVNTGSEKLDIFAKVAGVSSEVFVEAWEKNAAETFQAFVTGLGREGDNASVILDQLGLDGARSTRAFLSLANAGDLVTRTLDESARFWEENNALSREAANRYATTESQLKIFRNTLRATADSIGQRFLPFVEKLLEVGTRLIERWAEPLAAFIDRNVVPALNSFIDGMSRAVELGGGLIEAFEFGGISGLASRLGIRQEVTILIDQIVFSIRQLAETITGILGPALASITSGGILDAINSGILFLVDNFEAVKGALIGIGAVLAGGIFAAILAGLVALITPINLIIVAAAALGAAWTTNWMGIQETTFSVIDTIQNVLQVFVDAFMSGVVPPIQEAIANLTQALADLGLDWGDVWDAIVQATIIVAAAIGVAILAIISAVGGLAAGIASAIATATSFIAEFQQAWVQTIAGITQIIVGFKEFINGVFRLDLPQAIEGLKLLFAGLGNFIPGIFNLITTAISSTIAIWTSFFTAFKDTATGIFQALSDALIGNSIIPDMIAEIVAAFSALPELLTGIFSGIAETLGGAIGGLVGGIFGLGGDEEGGGIAALPMIIETLGFALLEIATVTMPLLQQAMMLFTQTFITQLTLVNSWIGVVNLALTNIHAVTFPALIAISQVYIQLVITGFTQINTLLTQKIELLGQTIAKTGELKTVGEETTNSIKEGFNEIASAINQVISAMETFIEQLKTATIQATAAATAASSISIGGGTAGLTRPGPISRPGRAFQFGTEGVMSVPSGGLTARLHPGEEFAVAPRGQSLASMISGPMVSINNPQINNGMDAQALGDFVAREVSSRLGGVS